MKNINLFLKGIIIGTAKIIPGVSGAIFAIIFGLYEKLLACLSSLSEAKKNIKFLLILSSGIIFAIIMTSSLIKYLLDKYYIYTVMLFIGMIISGLPPIIKKISFKRINLKEVIAIIITLILLYIISTLDLKEHILDSENYVHTFISLILCGIIDAASAIIPGISGTALLMFFGYYETIITAISNLTCLPSVMDSIVVLFPFGIGIIIGTIIFSKIVSFLFSSYNNMMYLIIVLLVFFSIGALFIDVLKNAYSFDELIRSIVFSIFGFISAYVLEKKLIK